MNSEKRATECREILVMEDLNCEEYRILGTENYSMLVRFSEI